MKALKIISFYKNDRVLVRKAAAGNSRAQHTIFEKYSPKMLGVCRQYIRDIHFAEDVMIKSFVKVFNRIETYRGEGSFEGWIRRIVIRECISFLRKKQFVVFDDEVIHKKPPMGHIPTTEVDVEHLQRIIDDLPEGYKMVFVLFAIEGYKHSEIAAMLDISESTSKSQLFKAKRILQDQILKQKVLGYGTK